MKHLDPKTVWLFFFSQLFSIIAFVVVISGMLLNFMFALNDAPYELGDIFGNMALVVAFAAIIGVVVAWFWSRLKYANYKYELAEIGFKKEEGVIVKKYVTIPYDRIQNVDIYRGVMARILGLSDLHIQTAGMSAPVGRYGMMGTEGRLIGLSKADAELLRDELIIKARSSKSQGI